MIQDDTTKHTTVPQRRLTGTDRRISPQFIQIPPLREMLRSAQGKEILVDFAKQKYQEESVLFWIAADEYGLLNNQARQDELQKIWARFLAPGSEYEVTVDALAKQRVKEVLGMPPTEEGPPKDLFETMMVELEQVMTSNVYGEYCKMVRRTGSLTLSKNTRDAPDEAKLEAERMKGADLMENLVIEPENYGVLYALFQVYTLNDTSHESEEKAFLSGVVEILLEHNSLLHFLEYVLDREVAECKEVNTLFRGRTVFTLILSDLFRRRPCVKFLSECTAVVFAEVMKQKTPLETDLGRIDPVVAPTPDAVNAVAVKNAEKLCKMADGLLVTIRKQYHKCPPSMRKLFEIVAVKTAVKFPNLRWKIVGSVFFLRFVNPALSQPEQLSLVTKEVTSGHRRGLVTLSKMLQYACNDTSFPTDIVNPAFDVLNAWVKRQVQGIEDLLSQMITINSSDWNTTDIGSPTKSNSSSGSAGSSPRLMFSGSPRKKSLADKLEEKLKNAFNPKSSDKLGETLTEEQSLALRLQVLDTLINHQDQVKKLLPEDMAVQTTWMWLKESLNTFIK